MGTCRGIQVVQCELKMGTQILSQNRLEYVPPLVHYSIYTI